MAHHVSNLEESVIRRTICVYSVPPGFSESDLVAPFQAFGEIQYIRLDPVPRKHESVALIQYSSEEPAHDAVSRIQLRVGDSVLRIMPSSITIEVIPPTDAIFGKPLTIGRHVMAVNPSLRDHRVTSERRHRSMAKVSEAAIRVLKNVSDRTGWTIPESSIKELENGKLQGESTGKSHRSSRRSSYSRSRSRDRRRRSRD